MTTGLTREDIRIRPMKMCVFKVEWMVGAQLVIHFYATKRWAKATRNEFGGYVHRGPEHDKGETGRTRHEWSESEQRWIRYDYFMIMRLAS